MNCILLVARGSYISDVARDAQIPVVVSDA